MSARVQLPHALREYTAGAAEIATDASDVGGALDELTALHPALRRHLFDDAGRLRSFVRVYVNNDDVHDLDTGTRTPLRAGDVILIVPSIAGGEQPVFSRDELARYSRHIPLAEVGWEGQQKLRAAKVVLIGAGGLGAPAGLYLAAAGIGTIGVVDHDVVDLSNLQRQILYDTVDVGRRKVDVAAERLRALNPNTRIVTHDVRLTGENALEILREYDVVIDGTDNFPTRYLVNDACVMLGIPYVYGSILRFEGQVSVFTGRAAPCYRCLFREPPPPGLVPNCAEGGVIGVLPGIIGSLQALEAIKLILGRGDTLIGRLALFDALAFRWRELKLRRNPDCPVCGDNPEITQLIDYDAFCETGDTMSQPEEVPQITPTELKERLDRGEKIAIIDVREPHEWDTANLADYGAKLIPLGDLLDRKDEIDPETETVIHCRSGGRSTAAIRQLRSLGYDRLVNLKGGMKAWAEEIDPSITL